MNIKNPIIAGTIILLWFVFIDLIRANEVKLNDCKLQWTASDSLDVSGYEVAINEVEDATVTRTHIVPSDILSIPCSDILRETDNVILDHYSVDDSGNRSNGLKGLEIKILDTTKPNDVYEFCMTGLDRENNAISICVRIEPITLKFEWNPVTKNADGSDATDLGGYRLYTGVTSRNYDTNYDVGLNTSFIISIVPDRRRYFAVNAYDNFGNHSDYSNEIIWSP